MNLQMDDFYLQLQVWGVSAL